MTAQLHLGDCLDVLRTFPDGSVDAVITDPPYSINTKSDGMGKLNPWADRVNAAFWYMQWLGECRRVLAPHGCVWSFLNWRSMVTFQKATDDLRWSIESLLIWDKQWIGPGGPKGLRPSYEMVALWAMPDFKIVNRSLYDIQRFPWSSHKPNGHPAEKPVDLLRWIVDHSATAGATVLDPFMGSGTTGVACVQTGRNFVGIEIDEGYYRIAERRIAEAQAQIPLLEVGA